MTGNKVKAIFKEIQTPNLFKMILLLSEYKDKNNITPHHKVYNIMNNKVSNDIYSNKYNFLFKIGIYLLRVIIAHNRLIIKIEDDITTNNFV